MTIIEEYRPAPREVPGELGSNVFTAGSELTLDCIVHGNSSGNLTYEWSVRDNPDTTASGCTNCVIDTSSPTSTLTVGNPVLYAGIYTCTVTEDDGAESSGNNGDFTVRVVGKMMIIILYVIR